MSIGCNDVLHSAYAMKRRAAGLLKGVCFGRKLAVRGKLLLDGHTSIVLGHGATIEVDGTLSLNAGTPVPTGVRSVIRVDDGGRMKTCGSTSVFYDADIVVFEGGLLEIGSSFINSGSRIRCHERISIGDGCAISHDFTVMDSDAHSLDGIRSIAPVVIGDHVWVGTRVTILRGVEVGEGAVIAAGSIVTKSVPPHALVAGVPATLVRSEIEWSL